LVALGHAKRHSNISSLRPNSLRIPNREFFAV
jgi:hypothetical protein